ncbi:MAG: hypothetical protein ACR2L2_16185 [Acidobacteriota bacterium]
MIRTELKPQLLAYMGGIVRQLDSQALLFNGTADHVHGLLKIAPVLSTAEVMRVLQIHRAGSTKPGVRGSDGRAGTVRLVSASQLHLASSGTSKIRRNIIVGFRSRRSYSSFSKNMA